MTDYGHDLRFGTFITPSNHAPDTVVDLAVTAEQAGLDLVTFQDHPYQPAFLDTWTLLSFVAARTKHIRLAPNVLNLPLRPPAVVARAAASLDLLSHGRFELGLGAGAFWDAIEAMGGERLTPGQGVDALSEAIDIIRGTWDPDNPQRFRVDGEHYQVRGAKRGPAGAHPIELWLGAYKPRMLRLVGAKADGWLPSANFLDSLDQLADGNARIDDAAAAADRDPRAIRRLLNVSGELASAEQLADLALTYGISTFIMSTDEASELHYFGEEVAPEVRDIVAAERSSGSSAPRPRSPGRGGAGRPASRPHPEAQLSPLLDYSAVPERLTVISPRDAGYDDVRSSYMAAGRPGLVIMAESPDDVSAAVVYAASQDAPLAVRSGGHGIAGLSTNDDGIVLDLSRINQIEILDESTRRIRVGAGATWGHVARRIGGLGWAITSGNFGDVGVGGLATAGGIGWLARSSGLTIDHVLGADLVLADGRHVHVDADHEPELYWAVRGGGLTAGVVTAFELQAVELPHVIYSEMAFDASDTASFLVRWADLVTAAPRELTSFMQVDAARGGQPPIARVQIVWAGDDTEAAIPVLEDVLRLGPVLAQQAQLVPYAALVAPGDGRHAGQQQIKLRNGFIDHLTAADAEQLAASFNGDPIVRLELRSMGGAVADVDPDATAFAHRLDDIFVAVWALPAPPEDLDAAWAGITPRFSGTYSTYSSDVRPEAARAAFPPKTYARLARIKQEFDPDHVLGGIDVRSTVGA